MALTHNIHVGSCGAVPYHLMTHQDTETASACDHIHALRSLSVNAFSAADLLQSSHESFPARTLPVRLRSNIVLDRDIESRLDAGHS